MFQKFAVDKDRASLTSLLQKQSPVYVEQEILSISRDPSMAGSITADEKDLQLMLSFLSYIEELIKAKEYLEFSQVRIYLRRRRVLDVYVTGSVEVDFAEEHGMDHCRT